MRSFTRIIIVLSSILTIFASSVSAATISDLDFSDWNADVLSTNGGVQEFANVSGNLDVTVTSVGEFDAPSRFLTTLDGGANSISTQHNPSSVSECHSYVFDFSEPTDLLVRTASLDGQESYTIASQGTATYTNESGAQPIVSRNGNEIQLEGVGFGQDALTGASNGTTFIDAPAEGPFGLTVSYCADPTLHASNATKFGSFALSSVSTAVITQSVDQLPEPTSTTLFGLGALIMVLGMRRRRVA